MNPQLNHTIVAAHDREESAAFLSEVLGFDPAIPFGPFLVVETGNGVSLDFIQTDDEIAHQHLIPQPPGVPRHRGRVRHGLRSNRGS